VPYFHFEPTEIEGRETVESDRKRQREGESMKMEYSEDRRGEGSHVEV
jgi:hypothetical protein